MKDLLGGKKSLAVDGRWWDYVQWRFEPFDVIIDSEDQAR